MEVDDCREVCGFSDLNYDCKLAVFSHLTGLEIAKYLCVCKEWYEIGTEKYLWKQYYDDEFHGPSYYGMHNQILDRICFNA